MQLFECSNELINHLDENLRKIVLKSCDSLFMSTGAILSHPGDITSYVYFPSGAVISIILHHKEEKRFEVSIVGQEGMVGIEAILGASESPYIILVQNEGKVERIQTEQLIKIIAEHPEIEKHLNLYTGFLLQQLAQSSYCNHFHDLKARLARLILMLRDRLHSKKMFMTHKVLADMLGVRRVGVTKAASILQRSRTLRYSRGHIEITNELALESVACSCYAIDKATYQSVLKH